MSLDIEQQLEVPAPREMVWLYLLDPAQVVACLPGAELLEVEDPRRFAGRVKVKIGAVTVTYKGRASLTEVDDARGLIRMVGEGTDQTGPGSARVTMDCFVTATPSGGTRVRVAARVELVGRIVQLGRGMIPGVAEQIFQQFAGCMRARLEGAPAAPPAGVEPVSGLRLLGRALLEAVARWVRRLFGLAGRPGSKKR